MASVDRQLFKGQCFFKYLCQLRVYSSVGGVSPALAKDIKAKARVLDASHERTVEMKNIFNWVNGSVIPKWAQEAAFALALAHGWKPVDLIDVATVLLLEFKRIKRGEKQRPLFTIDIHNLAVICEKRYHITFPRVLLSKIINEKLINL